MQGIHRLEDDWLLLVSEPGAWQGPADIPAQSKSLPARVPGHVAGALVAAGRLDPASPARLDDRDFWYVRGIAGARPGPGLLELDGLATLADVYVNGVHVLSSDSMFRRHSVPVMLTGDDHLAIAFRALSPRLKAAPAQGRWQPAAIHPPGLGRFRATLLGRMPGWDPEIDLIGPYRPVRLIEGECEVADLRMTARLMPDRSGIIDVSFVFAGRAHSLELVSGDLRVPVIAGEDGRLHGEIDVGRAQLWWPNGHGEAHLYPVSLAIDGRLVDLGRMGFRTITLDRGPGDEFALIVNGVRIFCRGTQFRGLDLSPDGFQPDKLRALIELARTANMNMIRVPATATYPPQLFFALCDEMGLMVWQDLLLARFDYPVDDPAFVANLRGEIADQLAAMRCHASLALVCGSSDIIPEADLAGLDGAGLARGGLLSVVETAVLADPPDCAFLAHAPERGPVALASNHGAAHYHGVGLFGRPALDARLADLRFAAECLFFGHVPDQAFLGRHLPGPPVSDPAWKAGLPRQRGASRDLDDLRDGYLESLYGQDPGRLRQQDPARYLMLSRAVTGEIIETVFADWRRAGSPCQGGLAGHLADLKPGAGCGLVDADGQAKPAWHAVRRAFRPVQAILNDEGTNGLDVHVVNDTEHALDLVIELTALKQGRDKVIAGAARFRLESRQTLVYAATDIFGRFFDTTRAFRLPDADHDVTVARLMLANRPEIGIESFHFPAGRKEALWPANLAGDLERDAKGWHIALSTDRFAQSVHLDVEGWAVSDNWFHLAPGRPKRIDFEPLAGTDPDTSPVGDIASLSATATLRFGGE